MRQAGDQPEHQENTREDIERFRIVQDLAADLMPKILLVGGSGYDDTGCGGDDQCRNLGNEPLTYRQQGIIGQCRGNGHSLLPHTDDHSADDVDHDDENAGDGIPADKFAGAVHGTVEIGLAADLQPAFLGFLLVDHAAGQIGVDRHLLARHRIEGETGGNFGNPGGAFGDDDEVDDHEDQEDDGPDDVITANDELAEGFDDRTRRIGSLAAMQQDEAGRGDVECEAEQGGNQQDRREYGKIEGLDGIQSDEKDCKGDGYIGSEENVEEKRRQRNDHQCKNADDCQCHVYIGMFSEGGHFECACSRWGHEERSFIAAGYRAQVIVQPVCQHDAIIRNPLWILL